MKINKKFFLVIIILLVSTLLYIFYYNNQQVEMSYNEFLSNVEVGKVSEVIISDNEDMKVKVDDTDITYITPNPRSQELKEYLLKKDVIVSESSSSSWTQIVQSLLMIGLFIGLFFFINKRMGGNTANNKMQVNYEAETGVKIKFKDIAGNEEAKESVKDLIDFIKHPQKYTKYGARMPRGIIFYGPPGTGKTLMAKAIAGEAGVPFYSVSGSDFVQMYVGVGASRIRNLFSKAHEQGKAVIFIDEIDALGKKRSSGAAGGNDERDQTLNALLTEMSGFKSREGIIVIAATNRLDILDSALLRPGRFDRQVEIGLPDLNARERILNLHSQNKPINENVSLKKLAKQTVFFSGAMLENLLNEAAIFAANEDSKYIDMKHVDKAFYTVIAGAEKKDRSVINEHDRKITAFHEAGHALITKLIAPNNSVTKVTIIPSSKGAGGFSMNIPPDKMYYTKRDMENQVMISLGGRAAEEIIFGQEEITTGASNDIEKATNIINDYVNKYGMSDNVGLLNMNIFSNSISNSLDECKNIIQRLYKATKELLIQNKYYLNEIAEALLTYETLSEEDIEDIFVGENIIDNKYVEKKEVTDFDNPILNEQLV